MPDEATETLAALSLIGRSLGFDHFPLPNSRARPPALLDVDTALSALGDAECSIPPAVKLNLLTHVPRSFGGEPLRSVVASLIDSHVEHGDVGTGDSVGDLLEVIYSTPPGQDCFHRRKPRPTREATADEDTPPVPPALLDALVQNVRETSVVVSPACQATTEIIDGVGALSLSTTTLSRQPLADLVSMTDPLFWPECHPQSLFFKEMDLVKPARPPLPRLPAPDRGWSARLREVVDFSYGLDPSGSSEMETVLDFVHFESDTAFGCTYDLHESRGKEILVDRGFVMVEDLKSLDRRRTTTLKQVYFRNRPQPGDVCRFWSLAHGMASSSCSTQLRSVSGSAP